MAITNDSLQSIGTVEDVEVLGGLEKIATTLGSDLKVGLSAEAVTASRGTFGTNRLPDRQPRSFLWHLMGVFEDTTIKILVASAVFSIVFGVFLSDSSADTIQGLAIVLAVVIVSGVNSFQNWSKDREFHSLAEIKADRPVQVIRSGEEKTVSIYDIVVGDIVVLAAGDGIPCDGLLVTGFDIEVNQSSMTGESEPVKKGTQPGCDPIMIGGTIILEGEGRMLATAVGIHSKMGQTVVLVENEEASNTPLQDRLEALADEIGKIGTTAGTLTFAVLTLLWFFQDAPLVGTAAGDAALAAGDPVRRLTDLLRFFIVGLSIVVVAVPEGLPLAVTISLAFSMRRMMRDNNLVRTLQACETMGSATVIASDKTGTLTENRMSVTQAWAFGRHVPDMGQLDATINNPGAAHRLAKAIALNSTADLKFTGPRVEFIRNPSEGALLLMLWRDLHIDYNGERESAPAPLARRPFNKETKYMSTVMPPERLSFGSKMAAADGRIASQPSTPLRSQAGSPGPAPLSPGLEEGPIVYTKGAPESVLDMCTYTQGANGTLHEITTERRYNLLEQVDSMARQGLRTLAVAYRRLPVPAGVRAEDLCFAAEVLDERGLPADKKLKLSSLRSHYGARLHTGELEKDMILLGLFGLQDPLREGVTDAVHKCQTAGIRIIMVTGDHRDTAAQIALQCGIMRPGQYAAHTDVHSTGSAVGMGRVMEGKAFRGLTPEERIAACHDLAVLARSSPMDKHLLVATLKEMGEVVAVTGDGTNDAPALRAADVGLAMGIAGTEVAKEASDIVILDDRFSSIVASVRWGRSIKENIRKFLTFQLTINIVALTLTFVTACTNGGSTDGFPITPVQLLWVNLIMDSFAALALATEPPSEHLMEHPPQGKAERLITRTMYKNMIGAAVFQTVLLLWLTMAPSGCLFFGLTTAAIGTVKHYTIVFTTFVALQVFNLFNCRAVHDEWNVLQDFSASVIGQVIVAIICVMQVVIVQFGGALTQTEPLSLQQWGLCVMLGFTSVPVGYLLKLIPACDIELRKLAPAPMPHLRGALYADSSSLRHQLERTITEAVVDEVAAASPTATEAITDAKAPLSNLVASGSTTGEQPVRMTRRVSAAMGTAVAAVAAARAFADGADEASTNSSDEEDAARPANKSVRRRRRVD